MEKEFEFFYKWVKSTLFIDLDAYKEKQLQRRILTVMKSAGAKDLYQYSEIISKDPQVKKAFLDYITINVTEFFRNKELFDEFEQILLNNLVPKFHQIKVWSAACSVGAEPYSIAMIFEKNNIELKQKIIATDIDEGILKRAKEGIFKEHEVKNVSKMDIKRYFTIANEKYIIDDRIKSMVDFRKHDLILDKYEKGLHAVLCRNVTIYFKNDAKTAIYQKINDSLVPGGIFFTGATESIHNARELGFRKISTFIYEKV